MPKIAISYRRAESSAIAGRICDCLAEHYGADSVFMDIDDIPLGVDFRRHTQDILQQTEILVAVIGIDWLGHCPDGTARISKTTDPVRFEIEAALKAKIPIVPVLVDGAKMPDSASLPAELDNFSYLNAAEVSSGRDFHTHMNRLIGAMDRILAPEPDRKPQPLISTGHTFHAGVEKPLRNGGRADFLRCVATPLVLLLVGYYVILMNNANNSYIWLDAIAIPFTFGFAFSWPGKYGTAPMMVAAVTLGLLGVCGMTVTESMISGDSILPQDRIEWLDNLQFAATIALSFLAGHFVARTTRALLRRKVSGT